MIPIPGFKTYNYTQPCCKCCVGNLALFRYRVAYSSTTFCSSRAFQHPEVTTFLSPVCTFFSGRDVWGYLSYGRHNEQRLWRLFTNHIHTTCYLLRCGILVISAVDGGTKIWWEITKRHHMASTFWSASSFTPK